MFNDEGLVCLQLHRIDKMSTTSEKEFGRKKKMYWEQLFNLTKQFLKEHKSISRVKKYQNIRKKSRVFR